MSSIRSILTLRTIPRQITLNRNLSQKSTKKSEPKSTPKSEPKSDSINLSNVTGLSSYVIKQRPEPLGPGASATGEYKVPEYFLFDRFSYHGAEVELAKYRCPQPSSIKGTQ